MPRAGLSRERLVVAAADLADEFGLDAVTLSELARRSDVKVASLYAHVSGLDELRAGVSLLALNQLADLAGEALAGRSGRDALVAFADAYRDYAREHPGRYAAAHAPVPPGSPTAPALVAAGRRHTDLTRSILRGYSLSNAQQVHAVRLLGSVFHGYATLELAGAFSHSRPSSRQSWRQILHALDHTLRTWPA